ncbi:hypothetical protein [Spirosoma pollinicola]|uniref:Uncharacterized protein n=1 Tax=Spirosoma pollinicola TaxID=2057025 RepID=A0A2K8Z7U8_9BACT|nr:hypothetical protein [Spirosoma pollinicola]AUD05942.1 hypothetical protein CWM47_31320 [Spirosoma pollinicola]
MNEDGVLSKYISEIEVFLENLIINKKLKEELNMHDSKGVGLVIGKVDFQGISIKKSLDCIGSVFYGLKIYKSDKVKHFIINSLFRMWLLQKKKYKLDQVRFYIDTKDIALNLQYAQIDNDLFLNDGYSQYPYSFKPFGNVNLHSVRVNQLFVSPQIGIHYLTRWKVTGLIYNYIYSKSDKDINDSDQKLLQECNWFDDFYNEDNLRQPYEQYAKVLMAVGDDAIARKVLLKTATRNWREAFLFFLLKFFSALGVPAYRSLFGLFILTIIGTCVYYYSAINGYVLYKFLNQEKYILLDSKNLINIGESKLLLETFVYSIQELLPINVSEKDIFKPYNIFTIVYSLIHNFFGTILLAMFVLGIARITRRS